MAISSGFGFSGRPQLHFCHCFRKVRFGSVAAVLDEPDSFFKGYSKRNSESVSFSSDGGLDGITRHLDGRGSVRRSLGLVIP